MDQCIFCRNAFMWSLRLRLRLCCWLVTLLLLRADVGIGVPSSHGSSWLPSAVALSASPLFQVQVRLRLKRSWFLFIMDAGADAGRPWAWAWAWAWDCVKELELEYILVLLLCQFLLSLETSALLVITCCCASANCNGIGISPESNRWFTCEDIHLLVRVCGVHPR